MSEPTAPPPKPLPRPNADTAPFWQAAAEGRFLFQECPACRNRQFYPRSRCRRCGADGLAWRQAAGTGRLHSFTVVERPPSEAFRAEVPYVLALVDLDEGLRFMCQVRNCDPAAVAIDMAVRVIFERASDDIRLPQVEPC